MLINVFANIDLSSFSGADTSEIRKSVAERIVSHKIVAVAAQKAAYREWYT